MAFSMAEYTLRGIYLLSISSLTIRPTSFIFPIFALPSSESTPDVLTFLPWHGLLLNDCFGLL